VNDPATLACVRGTRTTGRVVEVDSLEQFDALVSGGATAMRGWRIQSVDLRGRTDVLLRMDAAGALLLGCRISEAAVGHLRSDGALLFPAIPDVPFDPYRARLYTPAELYDGLADSAYEVTPDARAYAWSRGRGTDVAHTLAAALHDHAIDDALAEEIAGRSAVGVMGGHATVRGSPDYRRAAWLGRSLARAGLRVVTGGGPGAMEAANLGAFVSGCDDDVLERAVRGLTGTPDFRPSVTGWARTAFTVRAGVEAVGPTVGSVGIPTWFYGHEPPNVFASLIAKYFQNSLREDTLLRHCDAGIVFLPGAAGTVQEIFQDACENYYAEPSTLAPMVLVGVRHWTRDVPAWPLLSTMAEGRAMAHAVHLVDSVDEVVGLLRD
jgi:predicted Rossmann-fold nucleotide-binding protein